MLVLSKIGVQSTFDLDSLLPLCCPNSSFLRCTAPPNDLDGDLTGQRSHVHTDTLLHSGEITLQELWDDYGIVGELLVSRALFY